VSAEVTLIGGGEGTARRVLDATGADVAWDEPGGGDVDAMRASVRRTGVALQDLAATAFAHWLGWEIGLYAEVLPCKALEGSRTRFPETDLVVVRELARGAVGFDEVDRVVRVACEYAREQHRGAASVARVGGEPAEPAADCEELELSEVEVGDLCAQLVDHPEEHDMLVLPDLPGRLVGHLAAGMVGGLGLAPRIGIGEGGRCFGAAHEGAPENPTGMLLSGALMLRHLGEVDAADRLEAAIASVIRRGEKVTYDLKPTRNDPSAVGASEFVDAVIEEMENP